jgi:hypothetical protein
LTYITPEQFEEPKRRFTPRHSFAASPFHCHCRLSLLSAIGHFRQMLISPRHYAIDSCHYFEATDIDAAIDAIFHDIAIFSLSSIWLTIYDYADYLRLRWPLRQIRFHFFERFQPDFID